MGISAKKRPLRIIHAVSPIDLTGPHRQAAAGQARANGMSVPYTDQFMRACKDLEAQAWLISRHAKRDFLIDGPFRLEHRPVKWETAGGVRYHLGQVLRSLSLVASAVRYRADVAVVAECRHWWVLAPMRLLGIRIVPSLHCAFWPAGCFPTRRLARIRLWFTGRFWRWMVTATHCVSPECERQVRQLAGDCAAPILIGRALYDRQVMSRIPDPPASRNPFQIMFAGRIVANKGVFILLAAAQRLQAEQPGRYHWDICGTGPDMDQLRARIEKSDLEQVVTLHGHLLQEELMQAYGRCHVVVVPTTCDFSEGLNKVALEGGLAGRPVVTSRLSHALEVLGDGAVEVPPDDPDAYVDAIRRLANDEAWYEAKCRACRNEPELQSFYDPDRSWGAAAHEIIAAIRDGRTPQPLASLSSPACESSVMPSGHARLDPQ